MKTILTIILLSLSASGLIKAEDTIKDPIRDFLFTRDVDKDSYLPALKRVLVLKVDINNNGKPVTLLTFNGYGGKQGNFWAAYIPLENGTYRKANESDTSLFFRPDVFYVGHVDSVKQYGLLAFLPGRDAGDLNLLQIVDGKVTEQKVATLDLSNPQDKQTFKTYFGEAPDWKSLKNYPIQMMTLKDLKKAGYDTDAALEAVSASNHPLHKPLTNQ